MKIQADEEGKKLILSCIQKGMQKGAFDAADIDALYVLKEGVSLIEEGEVEKKDGK